MWLADVMQPFGLSHFADEPRDYTGGHSQVCCLGSATKAYTVPLVRRLGQTCSQMAEEDGPMARWGRGDKATNHDRRHERYCRCRPGGLREHYSRIFSAWSSLLNLAMVTS